MHNWACFRRMMEPAPRDDHDEMRQRVFKTEVQVLSAKLNKYKKMYERIVLYDLHVCVNKLTISVNTYLNFDHKC
jgi:hypothetical protein